MMNNFISLPLPETYFGRGQILKLPSILERYGKKVLMVYGGGSIKKNGIYDQITKLLKENGFEWVELSGVEPNPRITTVSKGIQLCKDNNVRAILAIGGGSIIDCSKAISVGFYYDGDDLWKMIKQKIDTGDVLPLINVLTIAGTGSESNKGYVISNLETKEKVGSSSPKSMPKATIMDPEFTYTVDKYQTASGFIDIMSHAFEAYFKSTEGAFLQNCFAEAILKTVIKYGPIAYNEPCNYEARSNLMLASGWALNGLLSNGKLGSSSCHPIEHALSAYYDITHGIGLAIIIVPWMRYILSEETVDKFAEYGVNVWGIDPSLKREKIARLSIDKTDEFFRKFDIPHTLTEVGIANEDFFEEMAIKAIAVGLNKAYVPLNKDDVINILRNSL